MFSMGNKDVTLQGLDMHGMHKSFSNRYDDLERLLEPDGRVFTTIGGITMYWRGANEFTTDPKDPGIWIGNRMNAMEKLGELFADTTGVVNINPVKVFYFQVVNTLVRFKYHKEEHYEGFKVWDCFNQMYRNFEVWLGAGGFNVDTKKPVAINFRDSLTSILIHANIENKRLTNAWVDKEGNLGVVEEFQLYTNNGLFDQFTLEPLPEDHPNYEVVMPTRLYPSNQMFTGMHHNHLNQDGAMLRPRSGAPY